MTSIDLTQLLDNRGFLDSEIKIPVMDVTPPVLVNNIDSRMLKMSYSSTLQMHSCPRKAQLQRLNSETVASEVDIPQSITFAFGHLIGDGVQGMLAGDTIEQAIFKAFVAWDVDIMETNDKQKKSLFLGIFALQQFENIRSQGFLNDYDLVYLPDGTPAIELSFCIDMGDGFFYRGFVDAVLKHKQTGNVIVLENKSSSMAPNPSSYKNSSQAIGYSVVLDKIFPSISAYDVKYLIYNTKAQAYTELSFAKTLLQRAIWLNQLLLEKEQIILYEEYGYPMHGESCFSWYRDCEYLGLCTLPTERLVPSEVVAKIEPEYMFNLTIEELIQSQIIKGEEV